MSMPITINNEEYLSTAEACQYLGGITSQTLRMRAKVYGIEPVKRGIGRQVYYSRRDLDKLLEFRPVKKPDEQ